MKFKLYAGAGVREYWIVEARARRVEVFSLGPTGYAGIRVFGPGSSAGSEIFPFSPSVDALFE